MLVSEFLATHVGHACAKRKSSRDTENNAGHMGSVAYAGGSNVFSPHGRIFSPHGRILSPHGRIFSPHGRIFSPHWRQPTWASDRPYSSGDSTEELQGSGSSAPFFKLSCFLMHKAMPAGTILLPCTCTIHTQTTL